MLGGATHAVSGSPLGRPSDCGSHPRVAAATMFAEPEYAVWTGPEGDGVPQGGDIPAIRRSRGSVRKRNFPAFDVTEEAVREALDTGLFHFSWR